MHPSREGNCRDEELTLAIGYWLLAFSYWHLRETVETRLIASLLFLYIAFTIFTYYFFLNNIFCIFAALKKFIVMVPKKTRKARPKSKGKTAKGKTGLAGILGVFKGMFQYDESIFNLGR